jgi:hypothetical protein
MLWNDAIVGCNYPTLSPRNIPRPPLIIGAHSLGELLYGRNREHNYQWKESANLLVSGFQKLREISTPM